MKCSEKEGVPNPSFHAPSSPDSTISLSMEELQTFLIVYYLDNNEKLLEKVKAKSFEFERIVWYGSKYIENIECKEKSMVIDIISKKLEGTNTQKITSIIKAFENIKEEIDTIKKLCRKGKYKECFDRYNKFIQSEAKNIIEEASNIYIQYSAIISSLKNEIEKFIREPTSNPFCKYLIYKYLTKYTNIGGEFIKVINMSDEEIKTQYLGYYAYEIILRLKPTFFLELETMMKMMNAPENTVTGGVSTLVALFNEIIPLFDYYLYFLNIKTAIQMCFKEKIAEDYLTYVKCLLEQRNPINCVDRKYNYVIQVLNEFFGRFTLFDKLTTSQIEDLINRISNISSYTWIEILPQTYRMCVTKMDRNCCSKDAISCPLEYTFTENDINNLCPGSLQACASLTGEIDNFCYEEKLQQGQSAPPAPPSECNPDEDLGCTQTPPPPPQQLPTQKVVKCRKSLDSKCPQILKILQDLLGVTSIVLNKDLNENNFCTIAKAKLQEKYLNDRQAIIDQYIEKSFWKTSPQFSENMRINRVNFESKLKAMLKDEYFNLLKNKMNEITNLECK